MNLWIVITIAGHLAETIGPIPRTMDECHALVADKSREIDAKFADPALQADPRSWLDGHHLQRSDVVINCEFSDKRPTT